MEKDLKLIDLREKIEWATIEETFDHCFILSVKAAYETWTDYKKHTSIRGAKQAFSKNYYKGAKWEPIK